MAAFERRFPKARHGALTDVAVQYGRTLTVHLLDIADAAMEDENIDRRARRRVINAILYGGSNPADVELRAAEQARFAEYVAGDVRPTPIVFNVADSDEVEHFLAQIKPKDGNDA